mmetsp:Transcript_13757/g.16707  ORF Transcript_13757/g.16707 Transcript_13757/m.16707 type:complete len:286 (-) Transcript_13757:200-1057(-)
MTAPNSTIIAHFTTKPEDMPRISTATSKPNHGSLQKFTKALNGNAMTIPSPLTELGHLFLTVKTSTFTRCNNDTPITPPTKPVRPVNPADQANETALKNLAFTGPEALRIYTDLQKQWEVYIAAKTVLRNLIINAVDETYISCLRDPITGYIMLQPLELLTFLYDTYGSIDNADNTANEARMKRPWNPPDPIETLWIQLEEGQEYADHGGEIIHDTQLMRWAYDNIANTGLFDIDNQTWRNKTNKTWKKFKAFYTNAEHDRSKYATAAETKYSANEVTEMIDSHL